MKKQLFYAIALVAGAMLSSCNKDLTSLDPSLFKSTPNPLETKAGKVDAAITGTFPVKYFAKNATVTVTPVLKYNGKESRGASTVFQGEKVVGNNQVIAYKAGGNYNLNTSFNYSPEMAVSELYLDFNVATKKKSYTLNPVKVADGIVATSELVQKTFGNKANGPLIMADKFQRVIQEMQEADIKFLIQKTDLRKSETKSEDVVALTKKIKEAQDAQNKDVSNFEIAGYASPDGSLELNTNLAEKRQENTSKFISSELKKLKTSVKIDSKFTAEDWDGFQKLMESSNIQDKQLIIRVLTMYTDPEQREREIKNLSVAFKSIADEILPQLRRSRLKLTVDVTGKSDAEIAGLAKTDASKLNIEELLYAATLTQNLAEKADIYQKAVSAYPECPRAINNLGVVKYQQGDLAGAATAIAKALSLSSTAAEANYNAGLLSIAQGDYAKAEVFFGKSAGSNGDVKNALGTIYMIQGDYAKAKQAFGSTSSNNAALLQVINKDYAGAKNTLASIAQPDATTSYLGAIVGARTNVKDEVINGLKSSVKQDAKMGLKAAKDLEFAKYFTDAAFQSIAK